MDRSTPTSICGPCLPSSTDRSRLATGRNSSELGTRRLERATTPPTVVRSRLHRQERCWQATNSHRLTHRQLISAQPWRALRHTADSARSNTARRSFIVDGSQEWLSSHRNSAPTSQISGIRTWRSFFRVHGTPFRVIHSPEDLHEVYAADSEMVEESQLASVTVPRRFPFHGTRKIEGGGHRLFGGRSAEQARTHQKRRQRMLAPHTGTITSRDAHFVSTNTHHHSSGHNCRQDKKIRNRTVKHGSKQAALDPIDHAPKVHGYCDLTVVSNPSGAGKNESAVRLNAPSQSSKVQDKLGSDHRTAVVEGRKLAHRNAASVPHTFTGSGNRRVGFRLGSGPSGHQQSRSANSRSSGIFQSRAATNANYVKRDFSSSKKFISVRTPRYRQAPITTHRQHCSRLRSSEHDSAQQTAATVGLRSVHGKHYRG